MLQFTDPERLKNKKGSRDYAWISQRKGNKMDFVRIETGGIRHPGRECGLEGKNAERDIGVGRSVVDT